MPISFYSQREEPYGAFSNFSPHPFTLGGKRWPTSEHCYQAMKFAGTPHEGEVRRARSPREAAEMGRDRSRPLRADWEKVKEEVMRRALEAKFAAHPALAALLLGTGEEELVEAAPNDLYWGCGRDGSGRNRLGHLLMELRARLRAAAIRGSPGRPSR